MTRLPAKTLLRMSNIGDQTRGVTGTAAVLYRLHRIAYNATDGIYHFTH